MRVLWSVEDAEIFRPPLGRVVVPYKDPEKRREAQRKYNRSEKGIANRKRWAERNPEKVAAAHRRWWKANPEKVRAYGRRYQQTPHGKKSRLARNRRESREKIGARNAINNGIRNGSITRPDTCEYCGVVDEPIEASHSDYSRPLDVEWLCRPCHRKKDDHESRFDNTQARRPDVG